MNWSIQKDREKCRLGIQKDLNINYLERIHRAVNSLKYFKRSFKQKIKKRDSIPLLLGV